MTYLLYDQGGECQLQSIELPKAARMSIKIISFELVWPQLDLKLEVDESSHLGTRLDLPYDCDFS